MWGINGVEIVSAFLVLFAIIDVSGSVPIFINLRSQNKIINPLQVAIYSLFFMLLFLFVGEWILRLFQVDISSFAVAGAIVLLILSVEMILGVEIFKNDQSGDSNSSTLVPVVFPLIAGPASFTTLLSMGRISNDQYHRGHFIESCDCVSGLAVFRSCEKNIRCKWSLYSPKIFWRHSHGHFYPSAHVQHEHTHCLFPVKKGFFGLRSLFSLYSTPIFF